MPLYQSPAQPLEPRAALLRVSLGAASPSPLLSRPYSKHHLGLLPSPCTAVFDLLTCKLRRLLGPCFKTGREWHCCTKLHCLQHHTPSGEPTVQLGHHQSGAATTKPAAPPWPGVSTGMSADTPGTSCVNSSETSCSHSPSVQTTALWASLD
jgi:hypothetical protein